MSNLSNLGLEKSPRLTNSFSLDVVWLNTYIVKQMEQQTTFGIRLSGEERTLIEDAAEASMEPGDRGGASSWARRVLLREAQEVISRKKSDSETGGV